MAATFRKEQRLLTAGDYRAVFAGASVKAGQREFLLLGTAGAASWHRLGLAVAKKHASHAVTRNRIKRVARECFRNLEPAEQPLDIVFLTRPGAAGLDRRALAEALDRQLHKLIQRATS